MSKSGRRLGVEQKAHSVAVKRGSDSGIKDFARRLEEGTPKYSLSLSVTSWSWSGPTMIIMDEDWGLAFADGLSAEQRRLVERVVGLIDVSDAQSWFSRPNLHLDGAAPVDLLTKVEGRAVLDAYILSREDGNYL